VRKRAPRTSSCRSRPAQTTSWAHSWAPSWVPYLQQPLHVHGQLGSDTPQHRRAARIFEWGGFVPIWSDLLRGSARRRSFYLSSWGCSSVSPAFGVWLPTSRVWMEKMNPVVLSAPEGLEELGPILNCGSGTSASSPSGSQTGSQSRSFVHFCVSRRVRERRLSRTEKSKNHFRTRFRCSGFGLTPLP
jgi:hypothetical protein